MLAASQPSLFQSSAKPSLPRRPTRRRSTSSRHDRSLQDAKPHHRSERDKATITQPHRRASTIPLPASKPPTPTSTSTPDPTSVSSTAVHPSPDRDRFHFHHRLCDMALDSTSVASISALAATARNLFRRAKISGPDFADVAAVVRSLHTVLKHMRSEAEDPDSLLNSTQQESSLYARQLTPIVEDTDFTLKQLDTILEKYGSYPTRDDDVDNLRRDRAPASGARQIEDRERDMLNLIRSKLANQKTNIDIFLDTVQLHNPSRQHQPVDLEKADDKQQNSIKDKIDAVAQRLFQRRARARVLGDAVDGSEEEMWQQFWSELVVEGFSSDVLRKHKEVLRAYIRELEENGSVDDEPPSVRGLLDSSSAYACQHVYGPRQHDDWSHKELVSPAMDNDKFAPSVKLARQHPDPSSQQHASAASMPAQLSYERYSSDTASDTDSHGSQQLALISTQDLMELDRQDADNLAAHARALQLSPALPAVPSNYGVSPGASYGGRYLPPPSTFQGRPNQPPELDLSSSSAKRPLGSSPRHPIHGGSPASSTMMTPPPAYSATTQPGGTAPAASSVPSTASGFPPPPTGSATRRSRLAPDSKGAEIPLDAKWTRIKRILVSPEVLDKAGFRYEARPDFVAVLGELSKDDIAHLARKTAEVRATRGRGYSDADRRPRTTTYYPEKRSGNVNKSSPYFDETDDEESVSSNPTWDDSDSESDSRDSGSRSRERRGLATDKYIPRDVRRQKEHRHRRHDSATVIQEEPDFEDADEDGHEKRGKAGRPYHPVIVAPPSNDKVSPASTVPPKPILKNRNENHVRFDEDGTPREMSANEMDRERRRERRRREGRDGEERRRRDKDRVDRDRDRDRERDRERDRGDRDRERERHRDRDVRDRDHHYSSSNRHRDRDDAREKRRTKKSVWGETLGAVGIGGAAASLLSVLTEAAAGF